MKNKFINISLFILTGLATLFIIELVMSLFIGKPQSTLPNGLFNQSSISYLTPGFKGRFNNNEISSEININSKGLRDKEIYYTNKNEEFRMLGLGDSFTFSYTSYKNNFLTILEDSLNKKNKKISIIKAGVPGTGPDFYYNFYKKEGFKYNPDLILINLYIGNDITNIGEISSFSSTKDNVINISFFYTLKTWLRHNSRLYTFIVGRIKGIPSLKKKLNDKGISPDVYEVYNKTPSENLILKWSKLSSIIDDFKNYNKKIIVNIIPSIFQIDKDQEKIFLKTRINDNYDVNYPTERLEKMLLMKNVDYINPLSSLQKANSRKSLTYRTDGHFNSYANFIIANEIKDFLISNEFILE